MKKKFRRIKYALVFLIQIVLLFICYGTYLNMVVKPTDFPYFGLLALIFPISFCLFVFFLMLSLFYRKKRNIIFIALAIPLGISFGHIFKIGFPSNDTKGIKVLTYNVKYGEEGFPELIQYLEQTQSDIIFLQELYKRHWRNETFLTNHFNAVHDFVGISSKYPILYDTKITLHDSNGYACMADIKINEDTIRAFSVYLGSVRMSGVLRDLESEKMDVEQTTRLARGKLIQGYKSHEKQLDILMHYIRESPYPVILGGDFNSVPMSYEYYTMAKELNDAFAWNSTGLATSFHQFNLPLKIDYIFSSGFYKSHSYQVDRTIRLSDHFPASVYLKKSKEE